MTWAALLAAVAPLLLGGVSPFQTSQCSHAQLEEALADFESCVDEGLSRCQQHSASSRNILVRKVSLAPLLFSDICLTFASLDTCLPRHFSRCFPRPEV